MELQANMTENNVGSLSNGILINFWNIISFTSDHYQNASLFYQPYLHPPPQKKKKKKKKKHQ